MSPANASISERMAAAGALTITASSAERLAGALRVGQVLPGRAVVDLGGGKWIVHFRGFNVVAASETPLPKDRPIRVEVTEISDRITMRLLAGGGDNVSGSDRIAEMLSELGVKPGPEGVRIAPQLFRFGLPVTRAYFDAISQYLARAGTAGEDDIAAAVFLLRKGLPLSREAVSGAKRLVSGGEGLSSLLEPARAALAQVRGSVSPESRGVVESLLELFDVLPMNMSGEYTGEGLSRFVGLLGLDMERELLKAAGEPEEAGKERPQARPAAEKGPAKARGLRGAAERLERLRTTLKAQLLRVRSALRSELEQAEGVRRKDLAAALEHVSRLLDDAVGQQIRSLGEEGVARLFCHLVFYAEGEVLGGTMRIVREKAGGRGRSGPMEVVVSMETTALGRVRARSLVDDRRIECDLAVESEWARELIGEHLSELKSAFSGLGYVVSRVGCLVEGPATSAWEEEFPPALDDLCKVDLVI